MAAGLSLSLKQERPIPLAAAFDCAPGELLALVGPSGSGKTTILRSVAGLCSPSSGRIAVNGEVWFDTQEGIDVPAYRRRAGMVFQHYALFPHMSAIGNVAAALDRLPGAKRSARAAELLSLVNLGGLEQRRPAQLSGGQQQRVALARALARDPAVLLLDEPFSAVDRATRQRLYRELAELRQALNIPVVLVTHDLNEAVMLADRICVLHHGRTLQAGAPDDILERPDTAQVARLVGLSNVFLGSILEHQPQRDRTLVAWDGQGLEVLHAPRFPAGSRVAWVIPDGYVVLHRRDRPSRGEHENPVAGRVASLVPIGQNAHLTIRLKGHDEAPLQFSVPLHVARRNRVAAGVDIVVSLLAEGIHLMPPEPAEPDIRAARVAKVRRTMS